MSNNRKLQIEHLRSLFLYGNKAKKVSSKLLVLNKRKDNCYCHLGKNIVNHRKTEIFNNYSFKSIFMCVYIYI